jgi:hypothetical protein
MQRGPDGPPAEPGCTVTVAEDGGEPRPPPPRRDLGDHSPTGLELGYGGSGPAQPALTLVARLLG